MAYMCIRGTGAPAHYALSSKAATPHSGPEGPPRPRSWKTRKGCIAYVWDVLEDVPAAACRARKRPLFVAFSLPAFFSPV